MTCRVSPSYYRYTFFASLQEPYNLHIYCLFIRSRYEMIVTRWYSYYFDFSPTPLPWRQGIFLALRTWQQYWLTIRWFGKKGLIQCRPWASTPSINVTKVTTACWMLLWSTAKTTYTLTWFTPNSATCCEQDQLSISRSPCSLASLFTWFMMDISSHWSG